MTRFRTVLAALMLVCCLALLPGCSQQKTTGSADTETKTEQKDTESKKDTDTASADPGSAEDIQIEDATLVSYTPDGADHPFYGYYFTYTNTGNKPVDISSFNVSVTGPGNFAQNPANTSFAPAMIGPGETGYGAEAGLGIAKGDWPENPEGLEIEITANAAKDDLLARTELECGDPEIKTGVTGATETNGKGLTLPVTNDQDAAAASVDAVVGLFSSSGQFAGCAFNIIGQDIPAGATADIELPYVVINPDMNLDSVSRYEPRADGRVEQK